MSNAHPICAKPAPTTNLRSSNDEIFMNADLVDLIKIVHATKPPQKNVSCTERVRDPRPPGFFARAWAALKRIV